MYGNPSTYERDLAYQAQLARKEGVEQVARPPMVYGVMALTFMGASWAMLSDDEAESHIKLAVGIFGPLFGGIILGGWWEKRKLLKEYADDPTLVPPPAPMSPEGFRFDVTPT